MDRSTASRQNVGFIGLGDQGLPSATAIADAGYELHVWARHATSVAQLGTRPYVTHAEPRQLAEACDVVEICINTDADVLDLVGHRLLAGLQSGTVVVNHGTGTPGNASPGRHVPVTRCGRGRCARQRGRNEERRGGDGVDDRPPR